MSVEELALAKRGASLRTGLKTCPCIDRWYRTSHRSGRSFPKGRMTLTEAFKLGNWRWQGEGRLGGQA